MTDAHADGELALRVRSMFDELLNRRKRDAIGDFIADDVVDHSPGPGQGPGRAGIADMIGLMLDANPELRVIVDDVLVEGDRVATRETWHTVNGIQHIAHFFRFAEGLVVEEWSMGWGDEVAERRRPEDVDRA
jgi:predicted SnoaL-like aldol condensation-catalyzing enzyme